MIDDALSALDAYVGKKIMDQVFVGALKNKTRIMVTHYLHLLDQVDKVIFIDKGKLAAIGSYSEIKELDAFKEFAQASAEDEAEAEKEKSQAEEEQNEIVEN
jgi:ABC-type transport system involved in cytochrome bd biosynthesis fused ATPase/permease subunit